MWKYAKGICETKARHRNAKKQHESVQVNEVAKSYSITGSVYKKYIKKAEARNCGGGKKRGNLRLARHLSVKHNVGEHGETTVD